MQTARRATASVTDPGDDGVPACDLVHDIWVGRRAVVGLHTHDNIGNTEFLAQHAIEVGEETLRPLLAVRDESNSLAGKRGQARCRLTQWRRRLIGGIEDLESHGLSSPPQR